VSIVDISSRMIEDRDYASAGPPADRTSTKTGLGPISHHPTFRPQRGLVMISGQQLPAQEPRFGDEHSCARRITRPNVSA